MNITGRTPLKEYRVVDVTQIAPYYEASKIERFLNEQLRQGWTLKQYVWQGGDSGASALIILERV